MDLQVLDPTNETIPPRGQPAPRLTSLAEAGRSALPFPMVRRVEGLSSPIWSPFCAPTSVSPT